MTKLIQIEMPSNKHYHDAGLTPEGQTPGQVYATDCWEN